MDTRQTINEIYSLHLLGLPIYGYIRQGHSHLYGPADFERPLTTVLVDSILVPSMPARDRKPHCQRTAVP